MRFQVADDTFAVRQAARRRRQWWGNDAVALPLAAAFACLRWKVDGFVAGPLAAGDADAARLHLTLWLMAAAMAGLAAVLTVREARARLREGFWFAGRVNTARGMLG